MKTKSMKGMKKLEEKKNEKGLHCFILKSSVRLNICCASIEWVGHRLEEV